MSTNLTGIIGKAFLDVADQENSKSPSKSAADFSDLLDQIQVNISRKLSVTELRALHVLKNQAHQSKTDTTLVPKTETLPELTMSSLPKKTIEDLGQLKDSSEKLEAVLIKQMLAGMEKTVPKDKLDGPMSDFARDMYRDNVSDHMVQSGATGLSDLLFRDMSRIVLNQARTAQATPTPKSAGTQS